MDGTACCLEAELVSEAQVLPMLRPACVKSFFAAMTIYLMFYLSAWLIKI
jgi:hypothetical protein